MRRVILPPSRHRVAGVDDEIDDHLLELVEVGLDQPQVAAVDDVELDRLADQPAQQHLQFRQHVVELQRLRAQRLPAREGEQLPHQPRRAIGVLLDLHDVLEGRIGRPVIGEQQVGIADDRGQHIVEVVRDAAGELADRLHLLALGEILLQRALLGGVEREDGRARALVALRIGGRDEEARRTRGARRLQRRRRAARSRPCPGRPRRSPRAGRRGRARRRRSKIDSRPGRVGLAARPARAARRRRWSAAPRPSASTAAIAIGVELKMRANRTSAARRSSPLLVAGRAVDHQRARGTGRAVAGKGDLVQDAHRQDAARGGGLRSTSNCCGRHFARRARTSWPSIAPPSPATMSSILSRPTPNWARS